MLPHHIPDPSDEIRPEDVSAALDPNVQDALEQARKDDLMEPAGMNQPKKFRLVLRPLSQTKDVARRVARIQQSIERAQQYGQPVEELQQRLVGFQGGERVIDADFVKQVSDKVMLVGIDPGNRVGYTRGFMGSSSHATALRGGVTTMQFKKNQPEFYSISWMAQAPTQPHRTEGTYEIIRKFETILSINMENIISINGKPVMQTTDLNKGASQLEFDDADDDQPMQAPVAPEAPREFLGDVAGDSQSQIERIAQTQDEPDMEWHGETGESEEDNEIDFIDDDEISDEDNEIGYEDKDDEDEPMEGKSKVKSINEMSGICQQCQQGDHDICPMVMGGSKSGMAFCSCECKPQYKKTSLGASPGAFGKLSDKQREEFPQHEIDPLDHIL
jgi:hypothetical protein